MRRFAKFLKDMFTSPDLQRLPAMSHEMTLHNALRICAGRVQHDDSSAVTQSVLPLIDVCWYSSNFDLHHQLRCLDDAFRQTAELTVLLVMGDFLRGNLRELIRQRCPAHRLVIVPHPGHWPGIDSFGDLALASRSLGWNSIEIYRKVGHESADVFSAFGQDERLLVGLPANTPARIM